MKFYKDKIAFNVLAGSLENAEAIYRISDEHALVGVLSANYDSFDLALQDMKQYQEVLHGDLSIGLGNGNPAMYERVMLLASKLDANHVNQVFSAVGMTRISAGAHPIINALVSPSGKVGYVKISTGMLSSQCEDAIVPVETACSMIKEMGGSSLKYFPMKGLTYKEELVEVAKQCAKADLILEPTGGIDLNNLEEILTIILDAGVKKVIPHIYSAIIDKESGNTKIEDVKKIMGIIQRF